ncbi:MAG: hypothetical protein ACLU0O_05215 [Collinsella sp.]
MPFREAHAVVGHLGPDVQKRGCNLEDLPFEVFQMEARSLSATLPRRSISRRLSPRARPRAAPLLPPLPCSCSVPRHSSWLTRACLDR